MNCSTNLTSLGICPICGSQDVTEFHNYGSCVLLRCKGCSLIFQDQQRCPDPLDAVMKTYDEGWVEMRRKYSADAFLQHASFNVLLLEIFCPRKGKLLEIGPGTGEFLYMAKHAGWQITGFEPSAQACIYARERFGLDLANRLWDRNELNPKERFDAIVFWHVLEHMPNPIDYLKGLAAFLKPGGRIFFSVPNSSSLTNTVYGMESPIFREADHLFHYNTASLRILLEHVPLKIVSLFSREEVKRLETDINAGIQLKGAYSGITFDQAMGLMAKLQSEHQGHELVCVCRR